MSDTRRLFFALWPTEEVRQAIHAQSIKVLTQHCKPVHVDNLHMTLVFLGNINKEKINDYLQAANKVQAQPFELELNQWGAFQRPQILWLGCTSTPAALQALVTQLNAELSTCGFVADTRPYVPHMSIARKYKDKDLPAFSGCVHWAAREFSLLESRSTDRGVEYHVLQSWPLINGA